MWEPKTAINSEKKIMFNAKHFFFHLEKLRLK